MDKAAGLPADVSRLIPLTPAVFFVLLSLSPGPCHGYAIMRETTRLSDGGFKMGPATLYTTIQRLMDLDLIAEVEDRGDESARRRYYQLTGVGLRLLESEVKRMQSVMRRAARLVQRHSET